MYNIIFHGIVVLTKVSYEEAEAEIKLLFRHYKTVGETASIVSPTTGKIVNVFYLDKDCEIGYVAIN